MLGRSIAGGVNGEDSAVRMIAEVCYSRGPFSLSFKKQRKKCVAAWFCVL